MSYTYDPWEQRQMPEESALSGIIPKEEEENLRNCIKSISPLMHVTSFVLGGALCAGTCYKFVRKPYIQVVGITGGIISLIMSRVAAVQNCIKETAPSLLDPKTRELLESRLSRLSSNIRNERPMQQAPAQIQEEPSIPTQSALEFDDPVSSTQSFSDLAPIATLEEASIPQEKKSMTYEELRKRHREEYQKEYQQRVVSRPRERAPEEPRIANQPHIHRNKYGDEME